METQGLQIVLGAPTGRAAKRLGEATARQASTVHRLLEATGGGEGISMFAKNEDEPLEGDVIIIDEVSMMDISLMSSLLQALAKGCRLILVGDVDQLPSVGPGSVLKDILNYMAVFCLIILFYTNLLLNVNDSTIVPSKILPISSIFDNVYKFYF